MEKTVELRHHHMYLGCSHCRRFDSGTQHSNIHNSVGAGNVCAGLGSRMADRRYMGSQIDQGTINHTATSASTDLTWGASTSILLRFPLFLTGLAQATCSKHQVLQPDFFLQPCNRLFFVSPKKISKDVVEGQASPFSISFLKFFNYLFIWN